MAENVPRIDTVSVVGPSRLRIAWRNAASFEEVDLSNWIATGGDALASLADPEVFAKAAISDHGVAVTWDGSKGDLSIDAHHLKSLGGSSKAQRKPIQRSQLADWRSELCAWNDPLSFRSRIDEICDLPEVGENFFKQAGLDFLRDAWIASRVASAMEANSVRLIADEFPDFELDQGGAVHRFEATEADDSDRRRGDEVWTGIEEDPVENWRKRFEAIPGAMQRVIKKKLAKPYPSDVSLVIYVNLGCYGAYIAEGLPILRDCTAEAKDKFNAVYAMWEGRLFRFWQNGRDDFAEWLYVKKEDF